MTTTKARLRRIMVDALELDRDPETIPDANLVEELGLDSINTLEYLIWVESEFGIQIADEDLSVDLINDLNTLATYVEARAGVPASTDG
jgi:acyl carrier protein